MRTSFHSCARPLAVTSSAASQRGSYSSSGMRPSMMTYPSVWYWCERSDSEGRAVADRASRTTGEGDAQGGGPA